MVNLQDLLKLAQTQTPVGAPFNPLGSLLAQQTQPENTITVTGVNDAAGIPPLNLGASPEPLKVAPDQLRALPPLEGLPERKGLFGIKGTLRNLLGALGDSFLVASGHNPIYAPVRARERLSDAMVGFTQNPLDAIKRVAYENPEIGYKMYNDWQERNLDYDKLAAAKATSASTATKNEGERFKEGSRLFGQYAGAIARDPKLAPVFTPILEKIKERYDLGDEFVIPGEDQGNVYEGYSYGGMPTNQQVSSEQRNEQLDISRRNAAANELRASREPQPRAAPNPTNASLAEKFLEKVARGEKLTPGQEEFLTRLGYPRDRGSGRRRSTGGGSSGTGKLVFRNGKLVPQQ